MRSRLPIALAVFTTALMFPASVWAAVSFAPAVNYPVDYAPTSVAIVDLNGDGKPDLVTANAGSDNVGVLLGNGNGTFAPAVNYGAGDGPNSVAIGDLNRDGDLDALVTNVVSDTVSVLLGDGTGQFTAATNSPVAVGDTPASVAIGDLNDDGDLDALVTNAYSDNVSVLLGDGTGQFTTAANSPIPVGDAPLSAAIGDLNGDGDLDALVPNGESDTVSVLLGDGTGQFTAAANSPIPVGNLPISVAIGDLNGDGDLDALVTNAQSNTVSVLLGDGTGQFTDAANSPVTVGNYPQGIAIGDLNDDRKPDLAVANTGSDNVSVLLNATPWPFTKGPTATIGGYTRIGSTLTAYAGSPSPTPTSFTYRWYANGTLLSNTARTLKLTTAHYGKRIQVKVTANKSGYQSASSLSAATATISNLQAKTLSMELNDYTVYRGQRVYAEIELLAPGEAWSIVLDGKKLASGKANNKGIAVTGFTIPTNATKGERIIRANGAFPDRTDPDTIKIR